MSRKEMTAPPKETNLRLVVLIVALVGTVLSLGLGVKWILDANNPKEKQRIESMKKIAAGPPPQPDLLSEVSAAEKKGLGCYVLLLAAVLGLAGAFLAYTGQAKPAGAALVAGGLLPLFFALSSLVATAPLLIAGGLSFVPREAEEEDEPVKRKHSVKPHRHHR
jgi:hypothetical protein